MSIEDGFSFQLGSVHYDLLLVLLRGEEFELVHKHI